MHWDQGFLRFIAQGNGKFENEIDFFEDFLDALEFSMFLERQQMYYFRTHSMTSHHL